MITLFEWLFVLSLTVPPIVLIVCVVAVTVFARTGREAATDLRPEHATPR